MNNHEMVIFQINLKPQHTDALHRKSWDGKFSILKLQVNCISITWISNNTVY